MCVWTQSKRERERERERERRERNAVNSGHYVLPATPKGSAHTSLGPKCNFSAKRANLQYLIFIFDYMSILLGRVFQ